MLNDKFPKKIFQAKVADSQLIAEGVKKISIKIDDPFSADPWQYVWVEIKNLIFPDQTGSRRAFSILNFIKEENIIEIIARIGESGYKQSLFSLSPGDEVIIHGPFGHSFILNESHQPADVVMIAGGVGIAPFLPIIKMVRENNWPIKCHLIYINKAPEFTPFLNELEEFKSTGALLTYIAKYEHFSWEDVASLSKSVGLDSEWWIAGKQGFVDQVYSELTKGGISRANMVFDNYYPTREDTLTKDLIDKQLQSDNIFYKAVESTTNHVVITNTEGIVLFANKAVERITGFSLSEVIGNTPRLWGGMMDRQYYIDFWKKKASGKPFSGKIYNRRKNGDIYATIAHIAPILDKDNKIIGYIGTEEDVTELEETATRLTDSEKFLSLIVENIPNMIFVKDAKDLRFTLFNKAGEEITGFNRKDMIGKNDYDFFPKDQADFFITKDKEVLSGKKEIDIPEEEINTKNKGKRYLHTKKVPIVDDNGNPKFLLGISEDITEKKSKTEILEKMNKFMVGRELKMAELKKEIKKLREENNK